MLFHNPLPAFQEMFSGNAQGFGGLRGKGPVFPEDAGATLGGDDGVVGVFQNQDAIGDTDPEGAATSALANDHGDDGHAEIEHFADVHGDGLGDVALLAGHAGEGSGSVDEADDGSANRIRRRALR